jgi:hypothetical protein
VSDRTGNGAHEDPSAALGAAVATLYSVFARYGLESHVEGCPCCVHDEDQVLIRSRPLRELTDDDLDKYARKAMTTWGDADDFRHFLPRLLELATGDPSVEVEILLSKLLAARWWEWPQPEQDAVESVLWLGWNVGLTRDPSEFDADAWLCGARIAGVDISRYVEAWRTSTAPTAIDHLVEFLLFNRNLLTTGELSNAFYSSTAANEASGAIRELLADEDVRARLAEHYETSY